MPKLVRFVIALTLLLMVSAGSWAAPPTAQQALVTLNVSAGYDGYFREGQWTPLLITVSNQGDAIEGRLVARQERSPALTSTFSTPLSLATGARQTLFLYVTLRNFAQSVTLELIDNNNEIITEIPVLIRHLPPRDKLYVVVSQASSGTFDLSSIATGGNQAVQANWQPANLPDKASALTAVNWLVFSDADSGELTLNQRRAVSEWVNAGGHLVVTGGANWQPTAAAFTDLLPLTPNGTTSVTDFAGLVTLAAGAVEADALAGDFVITTGDLLPDAQVLASSSTGTPLLTRRRYGGGTVDYLAASPLIAPLRGWGALDQLWLTLLTSVDVQPSWASGFSNIDVGIDGVELLPGYSALPEVTSLIGFLVLYIVLVGPVNYILLARINRRELAWLTIPVLIVVFSVLAWATGFNLRGNEVLLSRLTVVQSWANSDTAYAEQLIGLLAPRRANYTLSVNDNRLLRPVERVNQTGRFFGNTSTAVEVYQGATFAAQNFPVDASFVASFSTSASLPAPAISGQATISYEVDGRQGVRGTLRNDSDFTLTNPVILARGLVIRLEEDLAPGALFIFDEASYLLQATGSAPPTPIELVRGQVTNNNSAYYYNRYYYSEDYIGVDRTALDIIGGDRYETLNYYGIGYQNVQTDDETRRQQRFLNAFMNDQYNSTARANNVYLIGWGDTAPFDEEVAGAGWRTVDSTVYITALAVDHQASAAGTEVVASPDQFTWVALEREGGDDLSPTNLSLYGDNTVVFRYTPVPSAVLTEVTDLSVVFGFSENSGNNVIAIELWDWRSRAWETFTIVPGKTRINRPERFVGPLNAVQLRISRDAADGYRSVGQLGVEQTGRF
ncbi:MAG: hypothetical protein H7Y11_08625 [Armatimonadetes bacterium]|nr:hypothetical protein [Anaerolineae bacterium]